jgi:hypothetical protein
MPPENQSPRPLDFYHWLAACGMDPNRRRPLGRLAALLMDYRAYLEHECGKDDAARWFEKYTRRLREQVEAKP